MKKSVIVSALFAAGVGVSQADDARINAKLGTYGGGFGFGPGIEFRVTPQYTVSILSEGMSLSLNDVQASTSAFGFGVRRYFNNALTTDTYLTQVSEFKLAFSDTFIRALSPE